ncbi:MAG: hypothetical protein ACRDCE_15555 [Cetobacterium sp.]|uniref:hypothetical protein n=1 Tax=Cetobacterium sp. TaxID=2071632 RepID=UPI003EE63BD6
MLYYQHLAERLKEVIRFNASNPLEETKAKAETVFFEALEGLDTHCDYARFLLNFHLHPKNFNNVKDWVKMAVRLDKVITLFSPEKRLCLSEISDPQHLGLIESVKHNLIKSGVWE